MSQSHFYLKLQVGGAATSSKKRLQHWHFPMNFTKFLRTTFFQNNSGQWPLSLLLESPIFLLFLSSNSRDVYLLTVNFATIIQIHFDSYKVCIYVYWLNNSPIWLSFSNQCAGVRRRKKEKLSWIFYPWFRENPDQLHFN